MFGFWARLLGGVARGMWWMTWQVARIPLDVVEAVGVAVWRRFVEPPVAEAESTADIVERAVGALADRKAAIEEQVEAEAPKPFINPASPAAVRRNMQRALAYTTAVLAGETPPSLAHVSPEMCHELRKLRTKAQVLPFHRDLQEALGQIGDREFWFPDAPRFIHAPAHDPEEPGPTPVFT